MVTVFSSTWCVTEWSLALPWYRDPDYERGAGPVMEPAPWPAIPIRAAESCPVSVLRDGPLCRPVPALHDNLAVTHHHEDVLNHTDILQGIPLQDDEVGL